MAEPGDLVARRYKLVRELGSGGFGTVWRAIDQQDGAEVAVKLLRPDRMRHPAERRRFADEARFLTGLEHRHLARLIDSGEDSELDAVFICTELIPGSTLKSVLETGRRFTESEVRRLACEIASALEVIHGQGTAHRDVHPGNIMLAPERGAVLLDLGISRNMYDQRVRLTRSGAAVGFLPYMAPERFDSDIEDERPGDLFTLGIVLWEAFTRTLPHGDGYPPGVWFTQAKKGPLSNETVRKASPEFVALLRGLLNPKVRKRKTLADVLEVTSPRSGGTSGSIWKTAASGLVVVTLVVAAAAAEAIWAPVWPRAPTVELRATGMRLDVPDGWSRTAPTASDLRRGLDGAAKGPDVLVALGSVPASYLRAAGMGDSVIVDLPAGRAERADGNDKLRVDRLYAFPHRERYAVLTCRRAQNRSLLRALRQCKQVAARVRLTFAPTPVRRPSRRLRQGIERALKAYEPASAEAHRAIARSRSRESISEAAGQAASAAARAVKASDERGLTELRSVLSDLKRIWKSAARAAGRGRRRAFAEAGTELHAAERRLASAVMSLERGGYDGS